MYTQDDIAATQARVDSDAYLAAQWIAYDATRAQLLSLPREEYLRRTTPLLHVLRDTAAGLGVLIWLGLIVRSVIWVVHAVRWVVRVVPGTAVLQVLMAAFWVFILVTAVGVVIQGLRDVVRQRRGRG